MKKIVISLFILFLALNSKATNYYVDAVSGNDVNSGTSPGLAWRSIAKVNSFFLSFNSGDSILFHRGQIFYGCIIPKKGFTNGNPLKFASYSLGVNPTITGLIQIDSWTAVAGQTNLWEGTSIDSAARIALNDCNLVLINGTNSQMGRYPNADAATPWLTVLSHVDHIGKPRTSNGPPITGTLTGTTGLPANFTNGDVVFKAFNFAIIRYPILSQSGSTLTYLSLNNNVPNNGWGFFIENDSLATVLDQQNEWWYSKSRKKLRMYSVGNPNTLGLNVKMSTLDTLVYIVPPPENVTKGNMTFDGIDFIGSNRRTFFVGGASNITVKNCKMDFCGLYAYWGGSNFGFPSSNDSIKNCTINHVNSQGIVLANEYVNTYIGRNSIKNTGVSYGMFKVPALSTSTSANNYPENANWSSAFGSIINSDAHGTTMEYNLIDTSGYNGITYLGNNITIRYNEVQHHNYRLQDGAGIYSQGYRTPVTVNAGSFVVGKQYVISVIGSTNFISIGASSNTVGIMFQASGAGSGSGKATTAAGQYVNCKIYNNIVHHGLGDNSGTNNSTAFLSQGIYCDENTMNTQVYNNTCFENASYGIFSNSNSDCSFIANTCYGNRIGQILFSSQGRIVNGIPEREIRDTSKNNIFVSKYIPITTFNWKSWCMDLSSRYGSIDTFFTVLDSNIYARPINDGLSPLKDIITIRVQLNSFATFAYDKFSMWKTYANTFAQTNSAGRDQHSNKSPRTITNVAQLSLIYNPTDHDSTVILTGSYVDIRNVARSGSVLLTPYTSMVLISTGSLITPTITWANPVAITYSINLVGVLNATADGGVAGGFTYTIAGSPVTTGTVLNAGSYTILATFTPSNPSIYTTATKSVPLTVNKKNETLAYTVLSKVYTGSPLSPTVTTSPDAGLGTISTTYDGLGVTPTNVKAYAVITGLTNINYSSSSISGTFNITKATATITLSNLLQTFTNTPKSATVTTSPAGLTTLTTTYTGIAPIVYPTTVNPPTLAGSYTVNSSLVNANYNATPATGTLVISTSGATISLVSGDLNQVYSGANIAVRAVTNPIGQPYRVVYVNTNTPRIQLVWNGTDSVPRFAGTYNVTATLTGGGSPATGVLNVIKLTPIITWATPAPITVGTPLSATQLNATVNVASGTKIYRRSNGVQVTAGYILPQGNNAITMTFTPTNSANINVATKTVTVTVTASLFRNEITDPPIIENK